MRKKGNHRLLQLFQSIQEVSIVRNTFLDVLDGFILASLLVILIESVLKKGRGKPG